jgi:hypothetical protein
VRSVGGATGTERTARNAAADDSDIRAARTGETVTWSWRSSATGVGAGAAGIGGMPAVSQSHRRQWQPGESVGAEFVGDFPGRSPEVLSSQQEHFRALLAEAEGQQDRFLAGWQHDFKVEALGFTRSPAGAAFWAGVAQAQAWAGATVPITVETVSSRHTNGRTRHRVGIIASYSRSLVVVNSILPLGGANDLPLTRATGSAIGNRKK